MSIDRIKVLVDGTSVLSTSRPPAPPDHPQQLVLAFRPPIARVYTIEIVEPLGKRAKQLLEELGYRNVEVRIGDGYNRWPEAAPFDSIVVTAAPLEIPNPLIDQLKLGGRMVIPAGGSSDLQYLLPVEKQLDGTLTTSVHCQ